MHRSTVIRNEWGIALPVAIFALVIVGALVAGIFFTARIEVRSGENAMSGARAMEAAQAGLQMGYPQVISATAGLGDGQTVALPKTQLGTTGSFYADSVTRLNRFMYLLRAKGTYEVNGSVTSSRVVAMLVKRYMPELDLNAPVITRGAASVMGSVRFDGHDVSPPGWSICPASTRFEKAFRAGGPPMSVGGTMIGPSPLPYTFMDTTVQNLARVMDTVFFQFAGQANKTLSSSPVTAAPTVTGTTCKTNDATNWGDPGRDSPARFCESYFPIVYLNNGDNSQTYVVHGDGQGVLLVNGNLRFNGNSHFAGLILVRGTVQSGGGNIKIEGGLVTLGLDMSVFSGNVDVKFSSCAVQTAVSNVSVVAPATQRAFIQY
jgi:hypothetical protein